MKTLVILPMGAHPFHPGHMALYTSAREAFPDADVYVAATNDTSERPFPFAIKEKLAKLAGVEAGHFVQVKSPFQAREITQNYDPETTALIFVRSEKDRTKPPQAGGTKKDGTLAYLQPITAELNPMNKNGYMAYLPTVEFGPGMTSATEIRTAWPTLNRKRKTALVMSLYPKTQSNPELAQTVSKMLDTAIGSEQGMTESKGLAKKVKIVKGPDSGKTGWIREVKHGAFKGAPKTYYVDLDDGGQANNLPGTALRLVKDNGVTEAAYTGNIGIMELAKFFDIATLEEKTLFKQLMNIDEKNKAWKLIQKVTGVKLQGKEFAEQRARPSVVEDQVYEADASAVQFQTASTNNYQSSFTVTAIADGKNVGHFSFFRDPETDDVHNQAEVTDDVRGKGYGKALLLKAIEVANDHGLGFQEDSQSLSRAQSRVYDSLNDAGWIVDADGYWFLTPEGEQELARLSTIQQGMVESSEQAWEVSFSDAEDVIKVHASSKQEAIYKATQIAKSQGNPYPSVDWARHKEPGVMESLGNIEISDDKSIVTISVDGKDRFMLQPAEGHKLKSDGGRAYKYWTIYDIERKKDRKNPVIGMMSKNQAIAYVKKLVRLENKSQQSVKEGSLADAAKHVKKGALHKQEHIPLDKKIGATKLKSLKAHGTPLERKRANFALNIQGIKENAVQLSIQQLATISDAALDNAYHYGRSSPGNTFGWQANLKSAEFAKRMIDAGVTDIEKISDAIHKGWNVTAKAFVQNPEQFDDTEKLKAAGKLEAKLQQRAKLMNIEYAQLPNDEQEKDRVVAGALLQALKGQTVVDEDQVYNIIDKMMKYQAAKHHITPEELHDKFVNKHGMIPDEWIKHKPMSESDEVPDYDRSDELISRLKARVAASKELAAQGKKPETRLDPKTGKYRVDFTAGPDYVDEDPFRG